MAVEHIPSIISAFGAPDYRDWLRLPARKSNEEKDLIFRREIIPCLNDYAEGGLFTRFQEAHAWVTAFIDPASDFEDALLELERDPNAATITLADFVKHLAGTIITVAWQENMRSFVQMSQLDDNWMTEVRDAFEGALPKLAEHQAWWVLCGRLRLFSLQVGCASAQQDPLDCISGVRAHVSSSISAAGSTSLLKKTRAQAQGKRQHENYHIAWISPLEVEQIAALEMLDEQHGPLPQPHTDNNVYTLGSIKGHNVVIAGLPQTGNNSAAAVITQARTTFPNLRFCLLVGIGGGVPTTTDNGMIRLGDVVVSKPSGEHSGVLQYDHGKAEVARFIRTGALAPPPALLLSAAQALAAQRARSGKDSILSNIQRINTNIRGLQRYTRPISALDALYRPEYTHLDRERPCTQCGCDPSQRVQLIDNGDDNHFLVIHRGTIASGELVIKDARLRDALAEQCNILCFETEAAGVLANFPCLVIRGISDYCDSHKNDYWHGYAAATAAGYARELISYIPKDMSA
ncbi:uncharacterized protein N7482_003763 [Penicillium canariense]|uniref:Nucleoside phosphorylase domain-containing protein n=1 Tax=Penicillium canariense TaxID=189055 RepID=A0A9W9I7M5_9EURO|nr:uncharacterized protein N7482_003763 [Penicillium canariense]KAJ5168169.1 hypothetical protein N7482_003763 [Penicillium canariense]